MSEENTEKVYTVKPCMFEHEDGIVGKIKVAKDDYSYFVFCQYCGATGPKSVSPDVALDLWNRRTVVVVKDSDMEKLREYVAKSND